MTDEGLALGYAAGLLRQLGVDVAVTGEADPPALAWRRGGLMAVTGRPDGPGLVCPAALTTAAEGALMALKAIAPGGAFPVNGAVLLGERARLMGLTRGGRASADRSCRLIACADGDIALNLARPDDWDLVPLLLDVGAAPGWAAAAPGWAAIEAAAADRSVATLIDGGIELGLPVARLTPTEPGPALAFSVLAAAGARMKARPLVLDFSALWAGPLATSLLAMAGADVLKIESVHRPDGARRGHAGFYDLLNGGKRCVAIDFAEPEAVARLSDLVDRADIVVEASRPRALRRLGIDRERAVAHGCVWITITGYGDLDRVGFGDDAAIEGGVGAAMRCGWGEALFAGDAIADPLTGLHAALAAWALWTSGRSGLVHLSLARTTAAALTAGSAGDDLPAWQAQAEADTAPLYPLRPVAVPARALGADGEMLA